MNQKANPGRPALCPLLTIVALNVGVGCGQGEQPPPSTGETASAVGTPGRSVALGTTTLRDGREIRLHSSASVGTATGPCLTLLGIDRYKRGCLRAPSERQPSNARIPVAAEATAQLADDTPLEIYGVTSVDALAVEVRFDVGDTNGRRQAVLVSATDHEALAQAGIEKPFKVFFAELPPRAATARAIALDASGDDLGEADFADMSDLHPHAFIPDGPTPDDLRPSRRSCADQTCT